MHPRRSNIKAGTEFGALLLLWCLPSGVCCPQTGSGDQRPVNLSLPSLHSLSLQEWQECYHISLPHLSEHRHANPPCDQVLVAFLSMVRLQGQKPRSCSSFCCFALCKTSSEWRGGERRNGRSTLKKHSERLSLKFLAQAWVTCCSRPERLQAGKKGILKSVFMN